MANINKVALLNNGKVVGAGRNKDNSNLAPIEATTTASRSYLVGDYLMLQGEFYKVISAISIGDTLTVGTNIQNTNVGDEITDIKTFNFITKLWENPEPTQSYGASTINLSSSDYDMLLIIFNAYASQGQYDSTIVNKGNNIRLISASYTGTTSQTFLRNISRVSDTNFTVAGAYINGTQNNNALIPYQIYGIKMSIGV